MELSDLQKILVHEGKQCGLPFENILEMVAHLETLEQQLEMEEYLFSIIENPPSPAVIMQKARSLATY